MRPFPTRPASAPRLARLLPIAALALPPGVLMAAAGTPSAGPATPVFVDLVDHPTAEANWNRFYDLEDHLAGRFHALCADERCVPRRFLWPMQLRCSVRVRDGTLAACVWVVAGSDLRVRAAGSIDPDVVIWRCVLPVPAGLPVEAFHAALEVPDPLGVRLPGAAISLQQGVMACLSGPGSTS